MLAGIPRNDLDDVLFGVLRAINLFRRVKVREFGLDYDDIYLLQFLRRQSPSCMGDIAAEMQIPISTATRLIARLETMKLVSRRRDRIDRRVIHVRLLVRGEKTTRAIEDHTFQLLQKNLQKFDSDEILAFTMTAWHMEEILRIDQ